MFDPFELAVLKHLAIHFGLAKQSTIVQHIKPFPKGENRSPWKRKVYVGRMPMSDVRDPRYEYTSQGVRRLG